MTHLGTLSAIGKLWDGNKDLGPVDYEIQVFRSGGLKHGEGILRSDRIGLLNRFRAGQTVMLMLRSGEQVSVTIRNPGNFRMDISVTGPIPNPIREHDSADWSCDRRLPDVRIGSWSCKKAGPALMTGTGLRRIER
jgi:hypothetical protein